MYVDRVVMETLFLKLHKDMLHYLRNLISVAKEMPWKDYGLFDNFHLTFDQIDIKTASWLVSKMNLKKIEMKLNFNSIIVVVITW